MKKQGLIRFAKLSYAKRLYNLWAEMKDWRDHYRYEARLTDSPVLGRKLEERAAAVDDIMHSLDEAMRTVHFVS